MFARSREEGLLQHLAVQESEQGVAGVRETRQNLENVSSKGKEGLLQHLAVQESEQGVAGVRETRQNLENVSKEGGGGGAPGSLEENI